MNNQENPTESKLNLTQKILIIKELIALLNTATIKENSLTEIFANFLVIISNLFEEIEQRLKHLETKKRN